MNATVGFILLVLVVGCYFIFFKSVNDRSGINANTSTQLQDKFSGASQGAYNDNSN
jgi:hypothetical protein